MRMALWVVLVLDQLFILLIGSMRLERFNVSDIALKDQLSDLPASLTKIRRQLHKLLPEVKLLQQVELVLAGVVAVVLWGTLFGMFMGALLTIVSLMIIKILSRVLFVQKYASDLFDKTVESVLWAANFFRPLWRVLGTPKRVVSATPSSLHELVDLLNNLPLTVLTSTQHDRLLAVIDSETKVVKDVMTPKAKVVSVVPSATLGPIVLSDLQKSGHGYFPVVAKKSEPEGILSLGDIADIHNVKTHTTVRDIMGTQLIWVEEDTSLQELVQAFLQEKQYLMFVRNLNGDFTGIVTIADLLRQLIGVVKE